MSGALIALLCSILINFLANVFSVVIEFILITQAMMPTDVFKGVLDIDTELFTQWLPYVNWFVPLDYAVLLFGTFLDAYASLIIFLYFKRIIRSIFSGGSITKIIAEFLK